MTAAILTQAGTVARDIAALPTALARVQACIAAVKIIIAAIEGGDEIGYYITDAIKEAQSELDYREGYTEAEQLGLGSLAAQLHADNYARAKRKEREAK